MHDVVIAGGGPVGLFLAGELALSGCSVLVLERDPELASPLKALPLGLRGLNAGSAETFYRRALRMRERLHPAKRYPDGHPDLADSLNDLGQRHRIARRTGQRNEEPDTQSGIRDCDAAGHADGRPRFGDADRAGPRKHPLLIGLPLHVGRPDQP